MEKTFIIGFHYYGPEDIPWAVVVETTEYASALKKQKELGEKDKTFNPINIRTLSKKCFDILEEILGDIKIF